MSYRTLTGVAAGALALASLTLANPPALAGSFTDGTSCVGHWGSFSCVSTHRHGVEDPHIRYVPAPFSEEEKAEIRRRDQLWLTFCQPKLEQGRYGVEYYVYAAPGCEYGRYR
jgi:hypothetical protein